MITGEQVVADRKARKMSRKAYAELVGITQTQLFNIEKGRALKGDEEMKLVTVMGLTMNSLSALTVSPEMREGQASDDRATGWGSTPVATPEGTASLADIVIPDDEENEDDWPAWVGSSDIAPPTGLVPETPKELVQPPPSVIPVNVRLISNSELATYRRCKRKWWLGWHRHLRLKQERPTGALSIGKWVHLALARKYVPSGQVAEDPRDALERVLTDVYNRLNEFVVAQAELNKVEYIDATLLDTFKKDADLARAMVEGYVQWVAETGADEGLDVIAPETIITAPIDVAAYAREVAIIAKLDVRVRRVVDDVRLFIDHKTVGNLTSPVKTIHMNTQMLHYMLLERSQDDTYVDGALYNMLRKVKRTERATPPFYQRVEVRHNPHELVSYNTHMMSEISDMLSREALLEAGHSHHTIVPPTPESNCDWQCDFYPVCNMLDDGSRAEDMIAQYYVEVPHLDYYEVVQDEKGE